VKCVLTPYFHDCAAWSLKMEDTQPHQVPQCLASVSTPPTGHTRLKNTLIGMRATYYDPCQWTGGGGGQTRPGQTVASAVDGRRVTIYWNLRLSADALSSKTLWRSLSWLPNQENVKNSPHCLSAARLQRKGQRFSPVNWIAYTPVQTTLGQSGSLQLTSWTSVLLVNLAEPSTFLANFENPGLAQIWQFWLNCEIIRAASFDYFSIRVIEMHNRL